MKNSFNKNYFRELQIYSKEGSVKLPDAPKNHCRLFYSFDNRNFLPCGESYALQFGNWKGARVGLYSYNVSGEEGKCYFDWFHYDFD